MKKVFLFSLVSTFCACGAMASDMLPAGGSYEIYSRSCDISTMRNTLDWATQKRRAVVTVVKCTPRVNARTTKTVVKRRPRVVRTAVAGCGTRARYACNTWNA